MNEGAGGMGEECGEGNEDDSNQRQNGLQTCVQGGPTGRPGEPVSIERSGREPIERTRDGGARPIA